MTVEEQIKEIKPGETYPSYVHIKEEDGKVVKFHLQSYITGMYMAVYWPNNSQPQQTGDRNNKTSVRKLKTDIRKAIKRGATVTIGEIRPIKVLEDAS